MHVLFQQWPREVDLAEIESDQKYLMLLSETLEIPIDDIDRLRPGAHAIPDRKGTHFEDG